LTEVRAYIRWLTSDEPSRAWQTASNAMWAGDRRPLRWMARHLRVDPADPRAWFALGGFAPMEIAGTWHIAAPVPAPDPFSSSSFPGDDVVIVDPEANAAALLGDPGPALVAPTPQPDSLFVHTDPLKWLRAWADDRVVFLETRREAFERARIIPTFSGQPPAALAIGDLSLVPWPQIYARTITADFEHHKTIKRAIFKAADLPRVEAA
jgi:hypothetical protein